VQRDKNTLSKFSTRGHLKLHIAVAEKTSLVRLGSGHPGIVRLCWAFQDDWSLCELAPFAVILHVGGEAVTPLGWVLIIPNWAGPTLSARGGSCHAHYRFCLNAALSGMSASGNFSILVPLLCHYPFSGGRPIAMTSCRNTNTATGHDDSTFRLSRGVRGPHKSFWKHTFLP
jgi:hypothetical protein